LSRNRRNIRERRNINNYSKHIKVVLPIFVILICITVLIIKISKTQDAKTTEAAIDNEIYNANIELTEDEKESIENEYKRDIRLSVTVLGNILCENSILESVSNKNYDFSSIFVNIKKHTNASDITIAPVETNFINKDYSGNIRYNSPRSLAQEIKNIGTDILFLANNHSIDYGISGVKETKTTLEELELENVGTKTDENESNILIKNCRSIKLAFLSYTYGTNQKEEGYENFVNIINKQTIENDIIKAKEEGAEYIIVNMHWGNVIGSKLNNEQIELTEFLVNLGVDIIIGNHPASLQKIETIINRDGKDVLIVNSIGNFISSEEYQNSNLGVILNIELIKLKEDEKVYLNKVSYIPTYIQDNGENAENRYKILDIKEEISNYENGMQNISDNTYKKLKQGLVKIKELING